MRGQLASALCPKGGCLGMAKAGLAARIATKPDRRAAEEEWGPSLGTCKILPDHT